jgi:hypothetical protein
MPRYDRIFAALAERATQQGVADVGAMVRLLALAGASEQRIEDLLDEDLLNDGPVFGKFVRGLTGAAHASVMAATRQGEAVGHVDGDKALKDAVRRLGIEGSLVDALENANPGSAEEIELAIDNEMVTWIAELINTCPRCLPLHGKTRSRRAWAEMGLSPESIHSGWQSTCHCRLVPSELAESRKELLAPLRRRREKDALPKGGRKTERRVTQADLDAAATARDKAMETPEGRRTLRLLGQSGEADDEDG